MKYERQIYITEAVESEDGFQQRRRERRTLPPSRRPAGILPRRSPAIRRATLRGLILCEFSELNSEFSKSKCLLLLFLQHRIDFLIGLIFVHQFRMTILVTVFHDFKVYTKGMGMVWFEFDFVMAILVCVNGIA